MSETRDNFKNKTARNWTFTFNGYTENSVEQLKKLTEADCKIIIFGKELTKSGIPHLQGYIEVYNAKRVAGIKKLLDPLKGPQSEIHVEPRNPKATRTHNINYCSKGLQSHEEYVEYNEGFNHLYNDPNDNESKTHNWGPNYGLNADIYKQIFKEERENQGERSDWNILYERIVEEPKFSTILKEFPEKAIKYHGGIQKAIDCVLNDRNNSRLANEMNNLKLYQWENLLNEELINTPDKRKIIWYVDPIGGSGKSTFGKYLLAQGDCAYFTNAKTSDIAHAYNGERIAIFDFTKSVDGRVNYEVIESIKNGVVFSAKYNSGLKINATPHIVCFSNFDPDQSKLSQDRWDIRPLTPEDRKYPEPIEPLTAPIETNQTITNAIHELEDNIIISECTEDIPVIINKIATQSIEIGEAVDITSDTPSSSRGNTDSQVNRLDLNEKSGSWPAAALTLDI